ncbi:hypothetical protein C5N14_13500 [Micromonospora sp. MW-13]|uniref:hypothetical protein n=1 Tax=Micromonospora sp. MW-13 TaxID=2094022 RepID=UPI000ED07D15|nr:hypothetical protein [Micromonospora sp. MW-13]RGC68451.1 hypothetical protein C5N14_13500 [Micromonospora sp. MW-13]
MRSPRIIIRAAVVAALAGAAWSAWSAAESSAARADDRPAHTTTNDRPAGLTEILAPVRDLVTAVTTTPDRTKPAAAPTPPPAPPERADPPPPADRTPTPPADPIGQVIGGVDDVLEETVEVVDGVVDVVPPSAPPVAPVVDAVTPEAPASTTPAAAPPTTLPATDASPLPDGEAITALPAPAAPSAGALPVDAGGERADEPAGAAGTRWTAADPDPCSAAARTPLHGRGLVRRLLDRDPGLTTNRAHSGCPGNGQAAMKPPPTPIADQLAADPTRSLVQPARGRLGHARARDALPPSRHVAVDPGPA